ncbi:MAG: contractile injection system tape measure protein [Pyrinomonadaceae bacterium]
MDSVPNHVIRRQILEFRGVREADARQLQEEIGELFREKILPLLDRYLSEHSPGGVTHRIERLELNIGTVFRNNLEKDFIEKVTRQLEIYFQPQPSSDSNFKAKKEEIPAEKSHLETFSFFIETGNLPWWTDFKNNNPVKESLDFLLRKEDSTLRNLMYKWARQPDALKRIVIQTGFPKWTELAAANMDCTGEELSSMLSQLMDLLKKITPWNDYPEHKLQETVGLKLLPWVFLSPRKTQTTTDFWSSFLIQLTAGLSIKYNDLFAELFLQFEKNKHGQTMQEEEPVAFLWKNITPGGDLQANLFERIKRLLEFKTLAPEKKKQWLEYLQKLNEQVVEGEALQAIIQLLEQEAMAEPDKSAIALLSDKRKDSDLTEAPDRQEDFKLVKQEVLKLIKKEKARFSDTDELFVSNAGLVIFSPFLAGFFENLRLLEERRFANAAAAHRAVGLLQFLADGREIPAEHQCGLNKILCGLDAETVLEFGEPVTAEEAEACQILLEAVIANAPILGEMSVDGFRGSFLIRKGMLRAGAGAWHLNVERETFDIVLERFPWNWNIVKLPWMEWAISVEWI